MQSELTKRDEIIARLISLEEQRSNRRIAVLQAEQDAIATLAFDPQPPVRGSFIYWAKTRGDAEFRRVAKKLSLKNPFKRIDFARPRIKAQRFERESTISTARLDAISKIAGDPKPPITGSFVYWAIINDPSPR